MIQPSNVDTPPPINPAVFDQALEEAQSDWYRPGPSLQEFHQNLKLVRVVIGGRGSGKTTSVAMETIRHAWHNPGAKILALRKTEESQEDTSVDTFNTVYAEMGTLYQESEIGLFKSLDKGKQVRLPSQKAVEAWNKFQVDNPRATKRAKKAWLNSEGKRLCAVLEFRGLPDATISQNKLRGYECSMMILIEADLMQREDLNMGMACLRWKGYDGKFIEDTCVIIDTNPPSPRHWIAELEVEVLGDGRDKLPDSQLAAMYQFWHIPTRENIHNLPPRYVENLEAQYKHNPAMYKRMLLGEYAEAFDGAPVFDKFQDPVHGHNDLPFPRGAYLVRGWDFGNVNACIFSAYFCRKLTDPKTGEPVIDPETKRQIIYEYWWCLSDLVLEESDTERQSRAVLQHTAVYYPFWNDRSVCAGVLDYCDPAGNQEKDTGNSIRILNTYQIFPGFNTRLKSLPVTITICNRLLEQRDERDNPCFRIDRQHCNRLYVSMLGGYRYPNVGEPGYNPNKQIPLKGASAGNYDHPPDAWRYSVINLLRLAKMETEKKKASKGMGRKTRVNPVRVGAH